MKNQTKTAESPITCPADIDLVTPADEFFEYDTAEEKEAFLNLYKKLYPKKAFEAAQKRGLNHREWIDSKGLREDVMEDVAYEVEDILENLLTQQN